jgi:hypothetical protein
MFFFSLILSDNTTAPSIDEITTQEIDARVCQKYGRLDPRKLPNFNFTRNLVY